MLVQQIAVFLENKKGRIQDFTEILALNGVDLIAMSIADTSEYGILRAITSDNAKVLELAKKAGFTAACNDLIGISVDDKPGGLNAALKAVSDKGIDIEYLYSFAKADGKALILIRVEDPTQAIEVLKTIDHIELITNTQVLGGK